MKLTPATILALASALLLGALARDAMLGRARASDAPDRAQIERIARSLERNAEATRDLVKATERCKR